jgi:hypothetical protein
MPQYFAGNPDAGNDYFDAAGSAASVTATDLNSGASKGLGGNQDALDNVGHGLGVAGDIGSLIVSGVGGVDSADTANAPGQFSTTTFIIRRVTDTLSAGTANTSLRSGSSAYVERRPIHKVETGFRHYATATAIRDGNWIAFSGVFTAVDSTNDSIASASGGYTDPSGTADDAALASRVNQGEFAYRDHSRNPNYGQYRSKTG